MKDRDVLITGLGVISAAGANLEETLGSLARGIRDPRRVSIFETSLECPVFEVPVIPGQYSLEGRRTLSLALCALDEALEDAGLSDGLSDSRVGVCMGTTVASQLNDMEFYRTYRETGSAPMLSVDRYLDGNLADYISRRLGARGPSLSIVNACSSGTDAIGVALSWLRGGLCDIAVAGGADELNLVPLSGFSSLGIVSGEACAPFDKDRKGLNLGEGAGILILETEASARKRGKDAQLALRGYGSSADAYHLTAPHPEGAGLRRAIERVLDESGVRPEEVSFINAHGTATPDNDRVEARTLLDIFGCGVKVVSTKGFTGHTLGAAGGIEAVFASAALREGWIPPNAGFRNTDPETGLTPVTERTAVSGRFALSTSLAFGGNNAALVIEGGA